MKSVKDGTFNFNLLDEIYKRESPKHYDKDYNDPSLQNPELCAKCGGACCRRCGCFLSPDDFPDLTLEGMKKELDKGYITIESVDLSMINMEGFGRIVRISNIGDPVIIGFLDRRRSQPCILLGEHGCKLDWENRPAGGRLLVPAENGYCRSKYDLEKTVREWMSYHTLLSQLVIIYQDKEIPCSL